MLPVIQFGRSAFLEVLALKRMGTLSRQTLLRQDGSAMQDTIGTNTWSEYKRIKLRFSLLFCGWLPFGVLIGWPLPNLLGTYVPTYCLALAYGLILLYCWLTYGFYSCPNCGESFRGRQFYRTTCPNCGVRINQD